MAEASETIARRYCVSGRVQGVGFRWFVHREAAALGLRGSVRNTTSGTVAVLAAGSIDELRKLRAALERGSRGSRVDLVTEEELSSDEAASLREFTIEGAW